MKAAKRLIALVIAICTLTLPAATLRAAEPDAYVKRDTWQQTMLASRARLAPLLAEQQRQLQDLAIGPWYTTGSIISRRFSDVLFPEEGVDLGAREDAGRPFWRRRGDWPDGHVHMLENRRQATYLFRTITARAAVIVTAHVGSDNAMKIWLNGKELFAHEQFGLRRHQHATVELALVQGENRLLIKAYNHKRTAGFYFSLAEDAIFQVWRQIEKDFPIPWDWVLQDAGEDCRQWFYPDRSTRLEAAMIDRALGELGPEARPLREQLDKLCRKAVSADDSRWLDLYVRACEARRTRRLATLLRLYPTIVFTKHRNLGGTHYAYTECQSDAQRERSFLPTASLCIVEMEGIYGKVRTLVDDPDGMTRDPDVSFDGRRVLFSWKKSDREDDFHLYELDLATGRIRQLTFGLGFADYEGAYLPDGNILFRTSRSDGGAGG